MNNSYFRRERAAAVIRSQQHGKVLDFSDKPCRERREGKMEKRIAALEAELQELKRRVRKLEYGLIAINICVIILACACVIGRWRINQYLTDISGIISRIIELINTIQQLLTGLINLP